MKYHSAIRPYVTGSTRLDRWSDKSLGVAIKHSIMDGLPPEFAEADVLYTESPWGDFGQEVFAKRAGVESPPWLDVMKMVGKILSADSRPAIVISSIASRTVLAAHSAAPVLLNGAPAVAFAWNYQLPELGADGLRMYRRSVPITLHAEEMLESLAAKYQCVGDFFCGNGRSGSVFARHRKRFVMSDLNASCIGYIAEYFGQRG
jgi:hypothetical protein